ncbi:MAG: hypothetical protein Q9196_004474 [Gyalolechia fulgens]
MAPHDPEVPDLPVTEDFAGQRRPMHEVDLALKRVAEVVRQQASLRLEVDCDDTLVFLNLCQRKAQQNDSPPDKKARMTLDGGKTLSNALHSSSFTDTNQQLSAASTDSTDSDSIKALHLSDGSRSIPASSSPSDQFLAVKDHALFEWFISEIERMRAQSAGDIVQIKEAARVCRNAELEEGNKKIALIKRHIDVIGTLQEETKSSEAVLAREAEKIWLAAVYVSSEEIWVSLCHWLWHDSVPAFVQGSAANINVL